MIGEVDSDQIFVREDDILLEAAWDMISSINGSCIELPSKLLLPPALG